jgi:hypothetical protein
MVDPQLIFAFVERWHLETSLFSWAAAVLVTFYDQLNDVSTYTIKSLLGYSTLLHVFDYHSIVEQILEPACPVKV